MAESVVMAFDLGGTDIKAARVTKDGAVRGFRRVPSCADQGEEALFAAVRAIADQLGGPMGPAVAGFGCPGAIDPRTGQLQARTPHVALPADYPMLARLERTLGVRVALDNDANMAALGEHRVGAAKGARVSLTITIGTGVGCGIVVDDRVFRGAYGGAGEIGHMPLGALGPACRCGVPGCAEPLASGSGIVALAREAGLNVSSARDVFESGHPRAPYIVERMIDGLGQMLGAATQLLDPDVIVLGGGVSQAGERLLAPVRRSLERHTLISHRRVRVLLGALGEQAGAIGCGLAAWDAIATGSRRA
ncbi:MAG: ROK family protein [Candidatus Eisenbacteria bacterium]